jgi:hypothetical protein
MFAALNSFQVGGNLTLVSEVFSTTTYAGNGSTQTITNNIDVSTKGGLIWAKARSGTFATADHLLQDSARGFGDSTGLASSTTSAQFSYSGLIQSVSTTGFTTGSNPYSNASSTNYVAWTFREQPKFFDIVTYTGNGSTQNIAHSLGSVPGCIIVKRTDGTADWQVYHRSLANTQFLLLNQADGVATGTYWNSTTPTNSVFSVGTDSSVNASGGAYVAYIFAHDAGGFVGGNAISCDSYAGSSSDININLGYQVQWVMVKNTTTSGNWQILDAVRGMPSTGSALTLAPNLSNAESSLTAPIIVPTATGMTITGGIGAAINSAGNNYIYVAIKAS